MNVFDKCAENYDQLRKGSVPYLFSIISLLKQYKNKSLLDLGCGTGNLFHQISPFWKGNCVGLDISKQMLSQAQRKVISAHWLLADCRYIPFADNSFDGICGVYVLHLIDDILQMFTECRRVLKNGWVTFVSAPHHFIKNHPLNQFFPSFSRIDIQRFPHEEYIVNMLLRAGFCNISREYYVSMRDWLSEEYLEKVRSKFISTLHLIPDDEFREGIIKMKEEMTKKISSKPIPWESVLIIGFTN